MSQQVEVAWITWTGDVAERHSLWYDESEMSARAAQLRGYPRPSQEQRAELAAIEHAQRRYDRAWALAQRQWHGGTGVAGTDPDSGYSRQASIDQGRGDPSERGHAEPISGNPSALIRSVRMRIEHDYKSDVLPARACAVLEAAITKTESFTAMRVAEYLAATGDPAYARAFGKTLVMGPQRAAFDMSEQERAAMSRALTIGTPAAFGPGSYPVPYQLDPTVLLYSNGAINPFREICRVEQIVGREWLGVTSTGVQVTRQLESTPAIDATTGAFAMNQPGVAANRVQAFVPFSVEVEQDWNALLGEITAMIADAKDIEEAGSFLSGNGTAPNPQGILTAITGSSADILTATTATLTATDVVQLAPNLAPRFRARREWVGSVGFAEYARSTQRGQLVDTPLLADLPGDQGGGLLGRPFYELSTLSNALTTSASHVAMVGDWHNFLIIDRIGLSVELVPHLFSVPSGGGVGMPTGQRGVFALWRNNSTLLPPASANSIVALKVK